MKKIFSTPGVYLDEKNAFPNSTVQVATAVPAFIGYTEKAASDNRQLINCPTRITSLNQYHQFFGIAPKTIFTVTTGDTAKFKITVDATSQFNLYRSMRMFFANGGNTCYVVSVGDYNSGVNYKDLNDEVEQSGIPTLLECPEPSMLVIPDAVLLQENDCAEIQKAMLEHCGKEMRNRVAILDVRNGDHPRTYDDNDVVNKSREGLGNNFLQWGASSYPYFNTTIVKTDDVNFSTVGHLDVLASLLDTEADELYNNDATLIKDEIAKLLTDNDPLNLHQTLLAQLPLYKAILNEITKTLNILPPSGGMAGIISMIDAEVGVFQSPANVPMGSVISPTVNLTAKDQEDLNVPLNGKAINAIRAFPGKGVLVWGARTLDGNSQDWRYLSVRRTIIMIEQSLKVAARAYVFEPNEPNTWASVKGMMSNFLKDQWNKGALAGATPEDAFSVDIGLGITMTSSDILDGKMNITVKVAVTRPAEFIVITFQQQMQKS